MMGDVLFFRIKTKEKIPKERIKAVFFPTLFLRFAKGGRTLCAQTIAPLDATLRAIAWRRKNKAEGGRVLMVGGKDA